MQNHLGTNSFRQIVENHQEKVRNLCFRYLNNIDDAEDIAQEVFIQVFESLNSFRDEAQISTWIYRIAVNKSIDHLRKKKRKKRFSKLVSIFGFYEDENEFEIQSSENPQKGKKMNEKRDHLNRAIDSLPENQKAALILSKFEGFSNKEISEILNTSVSAVEALNNRAKKNLHKKLYDFYSKNLK